MVIVLPVLVIGSVHDTNVGGGKKDRHHTKDSHHQDDESIITSFYICIACGFCALDDPGIQFHL
jgi:succinate dehydrogenase/fumarate reductase-like Fe-S protein